MGTIKEKLKLQGRKLSRGDYRITEKAHSAANYLASVGNNVVADIQTTPPKDSFPFRIPQESKPKKKKNKTTQHHYYYYGKPPVSRKRKKNQTMRNPYPLV
jgi:hypothetical protein